MDMQIRLDDLRGPEVRALLEEHLRHMHEISPPESVHALDLDGLRHPGITFWTAWRGADLLGCGALKELEPTHGEIKSMRTAAAHRRKGVGRAMLQHALAEARARAYLRVSLETGSEPAFLPARHLYESAGFAYCPPFGAYVEDPNSVFMTLALREARDAPMRLVKPTREHLESYVAALERGWSPDSERPTSGAEELLRLRSDPEAFLASMSDRAARGPAVTLPDGTQVARLPGFRLWMWDGEFAGSIGLRWQPGSPALPAYCLGHIGYSVVPWKQGRGYATHALRAMLEEARAVGLPYVEVTTNHDNVASQRVIAASGGVLYETFLKPPQFGGREALRYRISLAT